MIEGQLGVPEVNVVVYPQCYHNKHTKQILVEEGVGVQVTALGKKHNLSTRPTNIQRIQVANYTSPEDLIREIKKLTQ